MNRAISLLPLVLFVVACASSSKPVDMTQPRRVLGTEADVRLDALVYSDRLSESTSIPITYDITNHRSSTILVADMLPLATYDPETLTVTVALGSEIPGENFLPRLIAVRPEEKKSFTTVAHVAIVARPGTPWSPRPNQVRIKLNFLGDTKPFAQLVDIHEKAVYDPKLAADLFTKWVDGNETVLTNTLPMRWTGGGVGAAVTDAPTFVQPRRGGRRGDRP